MTGEEFRMLLRRLWGSSRVRTRVTQRPTPLTGEAYRGARQRRLVSVLVGIAYDGRRERLRSVSTATRLRLVLEPDNSHDPDAVAVHTPGGEHVGYIQAEDATSLSRLLRTGATAFAKRRKPVDAGMRAVSLDVRVDMWARE